MLSDCSGIVFSCPRPENHSGRDDLRGLHRRGVEEQKQIATLENEKERRSAAAKLENEAKALMVAKNVAQEGVQRLLVKEIKLLVKRKLQGQKLSASRKAELVRLWDDNPEPEEARAWTQIEELHLQSLKKDEIAVSETALGRERINMLQRVQSFVDQLPESEIEALEASLRARAVAASRELESGTVESPLATAQERESGTVEIR